MVEVTRSRLRESHILYIVNKKIAKQLFSPNGYHTRISPYRCVLGSNTLGVNFFTHKSGIIVYRDDISLFCTAFACHTPTAHGIEYSVDNAVFLFRTAIFDDVVGRLIASTAPNPTFDFVAHSFSFKEVIKLF